MWSRKHLRSLLNFSGGVPKVGQLLNSAWSLNDTCRFKILQPPKKPKLPELPKASKDKQKEDYDSASMPPPPSPASSTCSDGSLSSPGKTSSSFGFYDRSFYCSIWWHHWVQSSFSKANFKYLTKLSIFKCVWYSNLGYSSPQWTVTIWILDCSGI